MKSTIKNKKVWLIFIILIAFLLLVGGTIPYFLFYIFLLTLLVPLIHNLMVLHRLKGYVKIPKDSIYVGDEITISYEIDNKSRFIVPYLEIENTIFKDLTGSKAPNIITTLEPKEKFYHKETITLKRRGYYQLGQIKVLIKDGFGLYTLNKNILSQTSLLVYPEPISLDAFRSTKVEQLGELMIEDLAFQDKSRISSVREYREGDSVKSIHWKLSAKLDELITKEYENKGDTNVVIFMNNYKKYLENDVDRRLEDKMVDISLSIINYYLNRNIPVQLLTQYEDQIVDIEGQQSTDLKPFLTIFAKFKGNGYKNLNPFIQYRSNILKKGTTVIIITPNLDKATGSLGIFLKSRFLKPLIIMAWDQQYNNGFLDSSVEKSLRQDGIPVYIIDYGTNIKEALEG
ncbi:DUF58 domain-containing protein [Tepidimicrobium xylanilyticum]|uniref:DUF58 domain-containing protein n=1 Tax=Tepidimicrobium xylanilyticum TaxID=1123352 RepID=UPI002652749E|nr:DUF58 domain-containing protein [Tepidimicrobium xylanilyticum]GMG95380.1 hypothetical protein EN5CB1_02060 [Tepidimicrobium xylanilyticum]